MVSTAILLQLLHLLVGVGSVSLRERKSKSGMQAARDRRCGGGGGSLRAWQMGEKEMAGTMKGRFVRAPSNSKKNQSIVGNSVSEHWRIAGIFVDAQWDWWDDAIVDDGWWMVRRG